MEKTEEKKTEMPSKKRPLPDWDLSLGRTCTTHKESEALLSAGLPEVTADFYFNEGSDYAVPWPVGEYDGWEFWDEEFPFCKKKKHFPCWSIIRLMQIFARSRKVKGEFDPITREKLCHLDFAHCYVSDFLINIKDMDFKKLKMKNANRKSDLPF